MKAKLLGRILSADFHQKKYVKVNNNSYTVEIANDLDLLIKSWDLKLDLQNRLMPLAPMPD
jgi:hypothetical protein